MVPNLPWQHLNLGNTFPSLLMKVWLGFSVSYAWNTVWKVFLLPCHERSTNILLLPFCWIHSALPSFPSICTVSTYPLTVSALKHVQLYIPSRRQGSPVFQNRLSIHSKWNLFSSDTMFCTFWLMLCFGIMCISCSSHHGACWAARLQPSSTCYVSVVTLSWHLP